MPTDNAAAWDRHSAGYQEGARLSTDVAHYGPDIGTEADYRLLGDLKGKRVLELGCGGAQCSIAFAASFEARSAATVWATMPSSDNVVAKVSSSAMRRATNTTDAPA